MRPARIRPSVGLALVVLAALAPPARAQKDPEITVGRSLQVLSEVTRNPKTGMPRLVMKNAQGIAIIPEMFKMSFIFGARFGRGVLVVRQPDGTWSNPLFIHLVGGSFGAQAGAQTTDLVLVFQSQKGLDRFLKGKGKLTLGVDVGVAAGPVGKRFEASTDAGLKSEILSYSNSQGIFAGVSAEGGTLQIDRRSSAVYYGQPASPAAILAMDSPLAIPESTVSLKQMLAEKTAWPERIVRGNKRPSSRPLILDDEPSMLDDPDGVEIEGAIRQEPLPAPPPRGSFKGDRPGREPSAADDLDAIPPARPRKKPSPPAQPSRGNEEDLPEPAPSAPGAKTNGTPQPAPADDDDDDPELAPPRSASSGSKRPRS
jgi:lipid-binding SYLF domain-containing protein